MANNDTRRERQSSQGDAAGPREREIITLPGPLPEQRTYIANIVKWERESLKEGVVIRGRIRRVGKHSHR